jgi:hypothetical protein
LRWIRSELPGQVPTVTVVDDFALAIFCKHSEHRFWLRKGGTDDGKGDNTRGRPNAARKQIYVICGWFKSLGHLITRWLEMTAQLYSSVGKNPVVASTAYL